MKRAALLAVAIAVLAPATASAFQLRIFHVPGGNIGCAMIFGKEARGGEARCDIAEHTWPTPPTPKSCELDYGQGLAVGPHRKAGFVCAGDTVLHQGKVLEVGQRRQARPLQVQGPAGGRSLPQPRQRPRVHAVAKRRQAVLAQRPAQQRPKCCSRAR